MKQIYFVLTDTGTILSKIVKIFMKDEYGHASISLDKELEQMYSFGRLNPYNAFHGGFVHEGINIGTFKRFYKTKAKIISIDIEDEQYENVKKELFEIEKNKKKYKFNTLGLFEVYFNLKRKKENYFYCAEFIKYILEKAEVDLELPELVRPQHFCDIKNSTTIYKGILKEYSA